MKALDEKHFMAPSVYFYMVDIFVRNGVSDHFICGPYLRPKWSHISLGSYLIVIRLIQYQSFVVAQQSHRGPFSHRIYISVRKAVLEGPVWKSFNRTRDHFLNIGKAYTMPKLCRSTRNLHRGPFSHTVYISVNKTVVKGSGILCTPASSLEWNEQ